MRPVAVLWHIATTLTGLVGPASSLGNLLFPHFRFGDEQYCHAGYEHSGNDIQDFLIHLDGYEGAWYRADRISSRLPGGAAAVGTAFGAAYVAAAGLLPDNLAAAETACVALELYTVASPLQGAKQFGRKAGFQFRFQPFEPLPARRVQCLLGVHMKVYAVHDHLQVALRLHEAAHHPEWSNGLTVLG